MVSLGEMGGFLTVHSCGSTVFYSHSSSFCGLNCAFFAQDVSSFPRGREVD
jgi:hypothetical protein